PRRQPPPGRAAAQLRHRSDRGSRGHRRGAGARSRARPGWSSPLMRFSVALAASLVAVAASGVGRAAVPVYTYEVVHTYPHDVHAFTEGLLYLNGVLYESTGLEKQSSIRKVQLESGGVLQKIAIAPQYFGEGIVVWNRELISLTWKSHVGFVFDLATLKLQRRFHYAGEGWALTQDGKRLIMSDGTADLRFL